MWSALGLLAIGARKDDMILSIAVIDYRTAGYVNDLQNANISSAINKEGYTQSGLSGCHNCDDRPFLVLSFRYFSRANLHGENSSDLSSCAIFFCSSYNSVPVNFLSVIV